MLNWELIDTPLANRDEIVRVPSEPELIAILVALLAVEDLTFGDLHHRSLELTENNCSMVVECLAYRFPMFLAEFENENVYARLVELIGLRVRDV